MAKIYTNVFLWVEMNELGAISYIGDLYDRYSIYYNTSKDVIVLDEPIDIAAYFKNLQVRTFLTQNDIIDSYESNEICYVKQIEKLDSSSLTGFTDFLKKAVDNYVQPDRNHMCTHITGVIVSETDIEAELIKMIEKFKYSKSYFFSLHGWSEIRLLYINPGKKEIITNKPGKKVIKFYKF